MIKTVQNAHQSQSGRSGFRTAYAPATRLNRMSRRSFQPRDHPDKEVRKALLKIQALNGGGHWSIESGGHWGRLKCAYGCCLIPVSGTPKNSVRHSEILVAEARKCPRAPGTPHSTRHPPDDEGD